MLLGPSGSGKSTLLNIIGGLDVPTSGEVRYRDTVLTRADEAELTAYRRRHVGFVFQFYNLIPSLTAVENVALVTEISDAPMNPDEALRMVNLGEREDHFPAQLSGGEQQRVAIARAIAKRPSVLLCDEPTGALDISTGIVVLEALARVNTEMGTTTVVITHNAAIASMADRVIRLADGRVTAVEDRTARSSRRSELIVVTMTNHAAQPQAAARPAGDEGPGAGHRDGRRRRRGDVRHVPLDLRLAVPRRATRTTSGSGSPTCSRRSSARRCAWPTRSPPSRTSRRSRRASSPT